MNEAYSNKHYDLPSDGREQSNERFGSIINFSNFLLHVLKIVYHNWDNCHPEIDNEIMLDDKRLLDMFNMVLKNVDMRIQIASASLRKLFVKAFYRCAKI